MVRWVRGTVNGLLMVTLVRPVVHRMVTRWRKRAQGSAATTIGIPVQELLEAALMEELGVQKADLAPTPFEAAEPPEGRSTVRTLIILGLAVALTVGAAVAIRTLWRRRREMADAQVEDPEWVAVPVEESTSDVAAPEVPVG